MICLSSTVAALFVSASFGGGANLDVTAEAVLPAAAFPEATETAPALGELTGYATEVTDVTPVETDEDEWQFLLSAYLWAIGLDGDVTAAGSTVPVDLEFSDVLDDFNGGGSLFFEGQKGRWGLGADATYVTLKSTTDLGGGASVKTDTGIGLLGLDGTYRLGADSAWSGILGLRFFDLDNTISPSGMPSVNGGISSSQFVVGVRGRWAVNNWMFNVRGDVGFADSSDSSWQLLALAGYQFGETWGLDAGYRVMNLDIEDGAAAMDVELQGLILGLTASW